MLDFLAGVLTIAGFISYIFFPLFYLIAIAWVFKKERWYWGLLSLIVPFLPFYFCFYSEDPEGQKIAKISGIFLLVIILWLGGTAISVAAHNVHPHHNKGEGTYSFLTGPQQ